ncbi:MAG: DUF748 domain-containing protein [Chitinivibrionales bacterium]
MRKKAWGKGLIVVLCLVLLLVLIGIDPALTWYANRSINRAQDISGRIKSIDLHVINSKSTISQLSARLNQKGGQTDIYVEQAEVDFSWAALLIGNVAASASLDSPDIRMLVTIPPEEKTVYGPPVAAVFEDMLSIKISSVTISRGNFVQRDITGEIPLEFYITGIEGEIQNITNEERLADTLFLTAALRGVTKGGGLFNMSMNVNPISPDLQFDGTVDIDTMELTSFNAYVSKLGGITFEEGTLSISIDIEARAGTVTGSVRSVYEDLLFTDDRDDQESIMQSLREAIGQIADAVLETEQGRMVTTVPIDLRVEGTRPDVFVILNIALQDALERSLIPL